MKTHSRRGFLKAMGAGAALAAFPPIAAAKWLSAASPASSFAAAESILSKLGLASYTTRNLSLAETVKWAKSLGLNHLALKDFHLPLSADQAKFDEVKNLIRQAGLDFYAVGVIYMKTESEVEAAFDYAKNAGVRMIVGVPSHELLDLTERKIKEYDIALAIHNHGPGDLLYPTCESAFRKVDGRDPRFGLCLDVGHAFRAGEDPAGAVKAYGRRILDIHLKDVDAAGIKGTTVEMGRGTIDLPALIRAVEQTGYGGNLPIEYEKDGDNPIPGLAESVGYFRGLLRGR
jgi:sugar phosphate isomerase/epimerase